MSGQDLHARYREALAAEGVDSDDWDQLDETDRAAWDRTAAGLPS